MLSLIRIFAEGRSFCQAVRAPSDLQSHYGNGVFSNVYLLALGRPIAVMGVVDLLGHTLARRNAGR
jgi:hypothetical protein